MLKKSSLSSTFVVFVVLLLVIGCSGIFPVLSLRGSQPISSYGTVGYTLSWLHTDGRWIKDSSDRKIRLRGTSTESGYALEHFPWDTQPEAIYDLMRDAKANSVRIFINKAFTEETHPMYEEYRTMMDTLVQWCKDRGIWVIFDLYNDNAGVSQDGWYLAPEWTSEQKSTALRDPSWVTETLDWWRWLAGRYKTEPTVVGYGLLNEPFTPDYYGVGTPARAEHFAFWRDYANKAAKAIHGVNSHALVFVGNIYGDETAWDWVGNYLNEPNVVYTLHKYYDMDLDWAQYYPYAASYRDGLFDQARTQMEEEYIDVFLRILDDDKPLWLEEFGTVATAPNWEVQVEDLYALMDKYEVGWNHHNMYYRFAGNPWGLTDDMETLNEMGVVCARCMHACINIPGDINGDGKVNGRDIGLVAIAFGSYPGDPRWNPNADCNKDDKIDGRDVSLVVRNFGKPHP